jgi:hypothetical protein
MSPLAWSIWISLICLAAGALYVHLRRLTPEPGAMIRLACGFCGKRVRYHERQTGRRLVCPNCFQAVGHTKSVVGQ